MSIVETAIYRVSCLNRTVLTSLGDSPTSAHPPGKVQQPSARSLTKNKVHL
ncbi:hypothetical protein [Nostoc sp.]|uniref:hypothetical protein n=1 Tax=Nostoc sp. TaxID=1180 RepID=UPI003FA5CA2D